MTNEQLTNEMIDLVIVDKRLQNNSCFSFLPIIHENDDFILYGVTK